MSLHNILVQICRHVDAVLLCKQENPMLVVIVMPPSMLGWWHNNHCVPLLAAVTTIYSAAVCTALFTFMYQNMLQEGTLVLHSWSDTQYMIPNIPNIPNI